MSRTAYVNGRYVPHAHAAVHIEDRGYQFADGVYEVTTIHGGQFIDADGHLDRLERSLAALRMAPPLSRRALKAVMRQMVRRNRIVNGLVYLQVTRGVARRDHPFPEVSTSALVLTARHTPAFDATAADGVAVITLPDTRWKHCDIKSVALLANVLGKQEARDAGAYEAWLVDDAGYVTEGTSSNAWIVTGAGELLTRHADSAILNGITRQALLGLAANEGIEFAERAFTVAEAHAAREAFLTSSTSFVKPVARIDDHALGNGQRGPLTSRIAAYYAEHLDAPGSAA